MFRPFRAGLVWGRCSQGVALGYRVTPRWGGGAIGAPISSCRIRAHATTPGAHNNRRITLAPTGRPVIARGNAPGKSPATSPSPERARFQDAVPCLNPRAPGFQRGIMRTPGQRPNKRAPPPPPPTGALCVGLVRVSPFQGWIGWGALFPGRCLGYRMTPRWGAGARCRTRSALPRCGQTGPLAHPFRLAAFGCGAPCWRPPNDCPNQLCTPRVQPRHADLHHQPLQRRWEHLVPVHQTLLRRQPVPLLRRGQIRFRPGGGT